MGTGGKNMKININDIIIEHNGDGRSIGKMINDLDRGQASYWHWHTLINSFERLYNKIKKLADYGLLLRDVSTISKDLEGKITQGSYDKERLKDIVKMYEFLLNEDLQFQDNEEGQEGRYGAY